MKFSTKDLIQTIRRHRGDVCVTALMKDDVFDVRVVKSDLIAQIARMDAGDAVVFIVKNGVGYIDCV